MEPSKTCTLISSGEQCPHFHAFLRSCFLSAEESDQFMSLFFKSI